MTDCRALAPNSTIAVAGSLAINLLLWCALANGTNRHIAIPPQTMIEVSRVEIDQQQRVIPKVIKPEEIKKQVKRIREVQQKPTPEKPPPPSHNRIITAPTPGPTPEPTVLSGGNADLGKKDQTQDSGTGKVPTLPPEPPTTKPEPPKPPPPQPVPTPLPVPAVKPTPLPTPPTPAPTPPKPKGPSRDASPISTVEPTIPDSLLSQDFKKSVRVRVHIAPDGSFTVELRSSCGNPDVDKLALEALKRWKWQPKLTDGEPQPDVQTFRFEFEVK